MKTNLISVIVPAAGQGRRMQSHKEKLELCLGERPILTYSLDLFEKMDSVGEIILVTSKEKVSYYKEQFVPQWGYQKICHVTAGGKRRQDSVFQGLKLASHELVLVHDGARPFVTETMVKNAAQTAKQHGACVVAMPCKATMKEVDSHGFVLRTPSRETLWEVQTPQVFRKILLLKAFELAGDKEVTDEAMLIEALGERVKVISGSYENIKITTPEDLMLAELILKNAQSSKFNVQD